MNVNAPTPDLESLIGVFYAAPEKLGRFAEARSRSIPAPYDRLLNHDEHMTVTVEAFHESSVDVQVLNVERETGTYSRRILLSRQTDKKVVQFGIVRLRVDALHEKVRNEIESETTPLGRVLIQNGVLRLVELCQLYEIEAGDDLAQLFGCPVGTTTYGRTAWIYCDGEPAVELLEIVTPVDPS